MIRCYIALGSNLDEPLQQVGAAVRALRRLPQSELVVVSPWYQSPAVGPGRQPDYINGVAALDTGLAPLRLLASLQAIETRQGRVRHRRWGARTLDLDLLLYGDETIELPALTVPHPRMLQRQFVLRPLLDVAPGIKTATGHSIAAIASALGDQGVCLVTVASSPTMKPTRDDTTDDALPEVGVTTKATTGDP